MCDAPMWHVPSLTSGHSGSGARGHDPQGYQAWYGACALPVLGARDAEDSGLVPRRTAFDIDQALVCL